MVSVKNLFLFIVLRSTLRVGGCYHLSVAEFSKYKKEHCEGKEPSQDVKYKDKT